jgi:hypothetical protein
MDDDHGDARVATGPVDHSMEFVTPTLVAVSAGRFVKLSHNLDPVRVCVAADLAELFGHRQPPLFLLPRGNARPRESLASRRVVGQRCASRRANQGMQNALWLTHIAPLRSMRPFVPFMVPQTTRKSVRQAVRLFRLRRDPDVRLRTREPRNAPPGAPRFPIRARRQVGTQQSCGMCILTFWFRLALPVQQFDLL